MRKIFRRLILITAALTALAVSAQASTITFEDLPSDNMFLGGGLNIGTFYTGLTFGPYVTGLNATTDYDGSIFPPKSGDIVVWSAFDDFVTVQFNQALSFVSIYYSSTQPLTLTAFDASSQSLGSITGAANTNGVDPGTIDVLSLSLDGISGITIGAPGAASLFILDDLTYTPQSTGSTVPEPSTLVLMASGLASLLAYKRGK
jgi:hypothetical protein